MNNDESANSIYLIILLVFVLSSFLVQARGRSAETWKAARIWGVILAILVILVSFRNELGMVKDRILGEVNPSATQVRGGGVHIRKSEDGHFHVDATVNDVAMSFIIDTGASTIVLSKADAVRLGINPDNLSYTGVSTTANGKVSTASIKLDSVIIGSITRRMVSAEVNDGEMDGSLLGMSFLGSLSGFSVHGDELILQP